MTTVVELLKLKGELTTKQAEVRRLEKIKTGLEEELDRLKEET